MGYKHPHPIVHHIELRIQTTSSHKAGNMRYTPHDALRVALDDLSSELERLQGMVEPAFDDEQKDRSR